MPTRKRRRLIDYDYSVAGMYFVTICTKGRKALFWSVANVYVGATCGRPNAHFSEYGAIVDNEMNCINKIYNGYVVIEKYIIMPDHIHMIILLKNNRNLKNQVGRPQVAPTNISRVIKQFKGSISKQIGFPIWQKSFHDRIIRGEKEYDEICVYIENNCLKHDCY